jgi:cytochrome P450 family 6
MNTTLVYLTFLLCAASLGIFLVLYTYFIYSYSYWKKKGVAYLEPSFPFGNIGDALLQRKSCGLTFQNIYNELEGYDLGGTYVFNRPTLVVRGPEMIKSILVKDFMYFHDHGTYFDEESDPLSAHLFMLTGQRWRNLRTKLTPTFTAGKIKMMFHILVDCGKELRAHVGQSAADGDTIEVKDILAKFSTDIIASFVFGIQCNCLQNPNAEFRNWGRKIFQTSLKTGIRDLAIFLSPTLASIVKIPFVPPDVTKYFKKMVMETIKYREHENVTRNDFMQLLIQMKSKASLDMEKQGGGTTDPQIGKDVGLTEEQIAAQAFVFFAAGFETSSTTMSFCLYELALNPSIQEYVQKEIDAVLKKHGNKITYEAIQEMEYLDNTISGK